MQWRLPVNVSKKKTKAAPVVMLAPELEGPVRLIGLMLALVTVVVYLPAGFHDFIVFDDPSYVTDNTVVQNGLTWDGLKWAFAGWHASNWHPLTWISHELDCELFGLNPGAQHMVNVLFHAANVVLLFHLWLRLTGRCWPSALVAALFAWHPLHVESVAWISERKDVLSTLFGLLALLAYVRFAQGRPVTGGPPATASRDWWLALVFFALGLLSKPMLVTLPCIMLLLDGWPLRRFAWGPRQLADGLALALEKWPFFLLVALSCVVTFLAQRQLAVVNLHQYAFNLRLENAVTACAGYVAKTFWPVNLSIFYPLPHHFSLGQLAASAVLLGGVSVLAWTTRRSRPWLLTGWLWFLGMLVPVIGLVQVGDQSMADRYTYLPVVGLFVAVVFGLAESTGKWPARAPLAASAVALAACVVVTEHQLTFWQDSESLFTHALAVTGANAPASMMLGIADEKLGRNDAAQQHYRDAVAEDDSLIVQVAGGEKRSFTAQAELILGQAAEQKGRVNDAIQYYREALQRDPDIVEAHNNLGNLLDSLGKPDEALAEYRAAVKLRPTTPLVHENLGTQLAEMGRFDEAMSEYMEAARLAPADARPVYLMGKAQLRRGQTGAAVAAFENALHLNPDDCPSLIYLARVLAADESAVNRNGVRAVALAEKANNLTGGAQPFILGTLAMAYAECGRFDDARKTVQSAIDQASGASPAMLNRLREQLKLYVANQPFRESFTNRAGD